MPPPLSAHNITLSDTELAGLVDCGWGGFGEGMNANPSKREVCSLKRKIVEAKDTLRCPEGDGHSASLRAATAEGLAWRQSLLRPLLGLGPHCGPHYQIQGMSTRQMLYF